MTLDPRAIATLGIGYTPAIAARLGIWQAAVLMPVMPVFGDGGAAARLRLQRRDEDELLLMVLM